jgi:hypothetical protein
MEFVASDYMFDPHVTLFRVGPREPREPLAEVFAPGLSVEARQEALYRLVVRCRPDLSGCVVYCFTYDRDRQIWLVGVSHRNLPAVPFGVPAPEQSLYIDAYIDPRKEAEAAALGEAFEAGKASWRDRAPLL